MCCYGEAVVGLECGAGEALRYYLFYSIFIRHIAFFAASMSASVSIGAHSGLLWRVLSSEYYRGLLFPGFARHV